MTAEEESSLNELRSVARRANAIPAVLRSTRAALRTLVLDLINAGEDVEEVLRAGELYPSSVLQWSAHAGSGGLTPEAMVRMERYLNERNQERVEAASHRDIARATFREVRTGTRHEVRDQRWNVLLERYREGKREHRAFHGTPYEYGADHYAYEGSAAVSELDELVDQLRGICVQEANERHPTWNPEEELLAQDEETPRAPNEYADLDPSWLDAEDDGEELPDLFAEDEVD